MKKSLSAMLLVVMLLTGWLGSFWFTRSRAIAGWQQENPTWLNNVSDDIIETEEGFCQWVKETKQTLMNQRLELAQLLEDPQSADATILDKAAQIGATHEELLRGVCQHLKSMRSVLPEDQKQLLRGFCRQRMQGQGAMHRRGRGFQEQWRQQRGFGYGNGNRRGQGQQKGCCGLTRKLQLAEEQEAIAQEKDPTFETDIRQLQNQLFTERQGLLSLLEGGSEPNGQLTEQFERFIKAYNALEQRLISYVLVMRPYFTAEQQKQIVGLCKRHFSGQCNSGQSD